VSEVAQIYVDLAKPIAKKYSLNLKGVSSSKKPSIGNITFMWDDSHDPSPISPARAGNVAWDVFSKAVQASFGDDVVTAPSAMTGNTGESIIMFFETNH
jgi:Gly-Xaa carboxypeptidase